MKKLVHLLVLTLIVLLRGEAFAQSRSSMDLLKQYKRLHPTTARTTIPTTTTSDSVFSVLGRWAWGPCYAVDEIGRASCRERV